LLRLNDLKFVDALAFGSASEEILGSRADVQTYKRFGGPMISRRFKTEE
jgi:hypothetical protein